ncbi:MAG: hypothetical protein GPJ54_11000 [Candidatus Heimdallarchaeota archaeon]|nr:hypothetical protein [Candidatus Heimdallarchaeota archaeon]
MTDKLDTHNIVKLIQEELNKIAGKDGTISSDEQSLIDSIVIEVGKYKELLDRSLDDGKIDQQERIRLFQTKFAIIQKAVSKIRDDMIVSKDEQAIIDGLQQLLPQISEYEDKFTN